MAIIGVVGLFAFAFGCQPPAEKSGAVQATKARLNLAYFPNITHSVALAGVSRDEFERALPDFALDYKVVNAGPEAMEALLAGEVDASYVGPSPAVNTFMKTNGEALRIIAGAASGGASLIAAKGSGITSIRGLDGKRVAIPQLGGTQDVSLRHFIQKEGLKPREKGGTVQIMPIKNPDILALFLRGQIDAAWVPEPWGTRLRLEAGGTTVVDERDLWPDGKFTTTVLVVSREFAEKHPDAVEGLVKAHLATLDWIGREPQRAKEAVNDELKRLTGKPLPENTLNEAWERVELTSDVGRDSVLKMAEYAYEAGYLKTDPRDTLPAIFSTSELEKQVAAK